MSLKKSKLLKLIILSLILISVLGTFGYAAKFKLPAPTRDFYVYDPTNVLSESTKAHIININEELYQKTEAQIVVAVVSSLEDRTREEFALELLRTWEVGGKKENNGIVFLISPTERETTIQVGYGLEGAITDGRAGEILDTYAVPYFKEDNYDQGILNGFNAIVGDVTQEYDVNIEGIQVQTPTQPNQRGMNPLMILAIVGLIMIDMIFFRGMFTFTLLRALSRGGGSGGGRGDGGNSGGGGSAGGGGAGRSW